jgi:hypothetical protein
LSKGDVSSKDMFPATTIYDDQKPAPVDTSAKLADLLGVREGEIVAVIIERRTVGGVTMVRSTLDSERQLTLVPQHVKKLGEIFLTERKRT